MQIVKLAGSISRSISEGLCLVPSAFCGSPATQRGNGLALGNVHHVCGYNCSSAIDSSENGSVADIVESTRYEWHRA